MKRAGQLLVGLMGLCLVVPVAASAAGADTPKADAPPDKAKAEKTKADKRPAILEKTVPTDVADLKAMQTQVNKVLKKIMPATVGIVVETKMGRRLAISSGSGVIINEEGYVLTAGHVSGDPDKPCWVILPDGKRVRGKTLGRDEGIDSGLVKILEKRKWPHVEMGDSKKLKTGQWCIAVGHPGGFNPNRTPPVRLGRILYANRRLIQTDCTLVGGDSGGPLFDLEGKVIGIHSRIGEDVKANIHVPVETYRETWDRLVKGEEWDTSAWGSLTRARRNPAYLGVIFDREATDELKVGEVYKDQPAEKGGVKVGDVLRTIDGKALSSRTSLQEFLAKKKPGDEVTLEVERAGKTVKLKVKLGKRPSE